MLGVVGFISLGDGYKEFGAAARALARYSCTYLSPSLTPGAIKLLGDDLSHDPGSFYFQIVRGSELILGLIIPATGASGTIKSLSPSWLLPGPHEGWALSGDSCLSHGGHCWALDGACL